jgi:short-subunit dehydrogenase
LWVAVASVFGLEYGRLWVEYACTKHFVSVRFGALEEVFMSYRPHGAWRTMEVLEELA